MRFDVRPGDVRGLCLHRRELAARGAGSRAHRARPACRAGFSACRCEMRAPAPAASPAASLPAKARVYVAAVVAAGAAALGIALTQLDLQRPMLFGVLAVLAVIASSAKIDLPLGRSQSNLSFSHAVNFWSLFALGPAPTVCIASASAWAQCRLKATEENPLHRVAFSVASLAVTVAVAGIPSMMLLRDDSGIAALLQAVAVVAPLYFVVNTALVAGAIALSTR